MHTLESVSDQNVEQRKRFRTQRYRSAASGALLGDLAPIRLDLEHETRLKPLSSPKKRDLGFRREREHYTGDKRALALGYGQWF
jgi:hypothetical protein